MVPVKDYYLNDNDGAVKKMMFYFIIDCGIFY